MATKIKIVTDSTADIPQEMLKEYDISSVPLKIIFGEESFRENIDIQQQEFYEKLVTYDGVPHTSQPSPGEFCDLYRELTADGSAVISIHISSHMSGTIQSARLAASMLENGDITVIDSKLVAYALGCVVVAAAKAAKAGKGKAEIFEIIQLMIEQVNTYFVVDTLEYLAKNGRIGKAAAFLGSMLNIKPVLTIEDGLIAPFEKVRSKSKALELLIRSAKNYAEKHGEISCFVFHANCYDEAINFKQKLLQELNGGEVFLMGNIGTVVGTHAGPGTIVIYFYKKGLDEI